jgi:hypothetical protein
MFGKALGKLKGLGTSSKAGSSGSRVKFDLQVVQVERLPQSVRKCRVMWSRSAKVQMTALKDVRSGGFLASPVGVLQGALHALLDMLRDTDAAAGAHALSLCQLTRAPSWLLPRAGTAMFKQTLTQVTSMQRDRTGEMENKARN